MIPLEQFGPVEQSSDFASHLCILAFQSVHFVDKFLMTTIVASTFAQLCLYVAGDDLLLDRVTAEIRERFQQLQNLAQKYAFLRPEVILSMDELNSDQAP
ncbi:hypothetical protein TNCV_421371 [Trichonephila clavipes]|nr:hypothetical protein TNCV_421371 [Trichonephila clavipes]